MIKNDDICFLIPSYDRYDKLKIILNDITKYHLNFIIFNVGSEDKRYYNLENEFKNIKIIHNNKNNGKVGYNNTVKTLLTEALNSNFKWFIYYADDMLLCENFIENVKPFINEFDIVNIFSPHEHSWGCEAYIDGFFIMSKSSIKHILPLIPNQLKDIEGKSTGVWSSVTREFNSNPFKFANYKLTKLNYSLCQHDGNDDSKLHPKHRLETPIIANNFYDYFYGEEIKITSKSNNFIKQ